MYTNKEHVRWRSRLESQESREVLKMESVLIPRFELDCLVREREPTAQRVRNVKKLFKS